MNIKFFRHLPDDRTANDFISRLLDANTPNLTLSLLAASPAFTPSLTNYNRRLHLLCANSHPLHALRLLYHMLAKGRYPNAISYTTLINGFSHIGELDTARQLFDKMSHSGIQPNSLTFSFLIKGVLRERRVDVVWALIVNLWAKMEEEDDRTTNNAAFANLIGSLCREGFFHKVFRIAEEMPPGKYVGEEFAYSQMIDLLCRAGRHHGASRIVYILRKRGFINGL